MKIYSLENVVCAHYINYTNVLNSATGKKLQLLECLDFIAECAKEIKQLMIKHDVVEITNSEYKTLITLFKPFPCMYLDDDNIRLYFSKGIAFGSGKETLIIKYLAKWEDSKNRPIELDIRKFK